MKKMRFNMQKRSLDRATKTMLMSLLTKDVFYIRRINLKKPESGSRKQ